MRTLILFFLVLCLHAIPVAADDLSEVRELLQSRIDAVVVLLQDKQLDKSARNTRILELVAPLFDYQTMAKLSLGKKYWPTLNASEQSEFSRLFTQRLQESYLEKLDIYTDEKVLYGEPVATGKQVQAPTTLVSKDSRIEVLYKFYRPADGWQIYDVEVGGVSVIQTYRSQFDGVLSAGSVDDLFEKLQASGSFKIPEPGTAPN